MIGRNLIFIFFIALKFQAQHKLLQDLELRKTKDNSTASKFATEEWILSKLNKYVPNYLNFDETELEKKLNGALLSHSQDHPNFSFSNGYLIFKYRHVSSHSKSETWYTIKIPIDDLKTVRFIKGCIVFKTYGTTIMDGSKGHNSILDAIEDPKNLTDNYRYEFNSIGEANLSKRLITAFSHLTHFYKLKKVKVKKELF